MDSCDRASDNDSHEEFEDDELLDSDCDFELSFSEDNLGDDDNKATDVDSVPASAALDLHVHRRSVMVSYHLGHILTCTLH